MLLPQPYVMDLTNAKIKFFYADMFCFEQVWFHKMMAKHKILSSHITTYGADVKVYFILEEVIKETEDATNPRND